MPKKRVSLPKLGWIAIATLFCLNIAAFRSEAHELQPAIVDLKVASDGTVNLTITANIEAAIVRIGPEHDNTETSPRAADYNALRDLPPVDLETRFIAFARTELEDGLLSLNGTPLSLSAPAMNVPAVGDTRTARQSTFTYETRLNAAGGTLIWRLPEVFGDNVLRIYAEGQDNPLYAAFLQAGESADVDLDANLFPAGESSTLATYIKVGFLHILPKGLDHVLFIVGLFLLNPAWRPLLAQVSIFTVAHSVTLALGILGFVHVPSQIVEPLIAASIAFIAVENLFTEKLRRWRTGIVFVFGLLHGLGFASALREYATTDGHFFSSLLGLNIGVELGQITVVLICYGLVGFWLGHRRWYHALIVVPASLVIFCISSYWLLERLGIWT